MSTGRKLAREDLVARLSSGIPEVSGRVFNSRPQALGEIELPAVCVYSKSENVRTVNSCPAMHDRGLQVYVEVMVRGSETLDNDLDDLCEKVEQELLQSSKQTLFSKIELVSIDMGFSDQGRKPIGAARLTFEIGYLKTFI